METKVKLKNRISKIIKLLKKEYPDGKTALHFSNPLELLIATILSAQCTDERVNTVTSNLFKKYTSTRDYADVELTELEKDIHSTGFYKNKAKSIKNCCREIGEHFSGEVPATMEDLITLPGVGRKTANVVLGSAFGIPGIVVDTHVGRLTQRLELTDQDDPDKIEFELMELIPKNEWTPFSFLLVDHGRKICQSRKPHCFECKLNKLCPYQDKTPEK